MYIRQVIKKSKPVKFKDIVQKSNAFQRNETIDIHKYIILISWLLSYNLNGLTSLIEVDMLTNS